MQNIQMYKILIVNMVINMTDHTIPSKLLELRQRYYSFIQIFVNNEYIKFDYNKHVYV